MPTLEMRSSNLESSAGQVVSTCSHCNEIRDKNITLVARILLLEVEVEVATLKGLKQPDCVDSVKPDETIKTAVSPDKVITAELNGKRQNNHHEKVAPKHTHVAESSKATLSSNLNGRVQEQSSASTHRPWQQVTKRK